jgi:hypothetical protein
MKREEILFALLFYHKRERERESGNLAVKFSLLFFIDDEKILYNAFPHSSITERIGNGEMEWMKISSLCFSINDFMHQQE